jgi:hypothetical protein
LHPAATPTEAAKRPAAPSPPAPVDEPPPPALDEPYEIDYEMPHAAPPPESAGGDAGLKIKDAVEQRGKKFLRAALDRAESIGIEGQFLRVSFSAEDGVYKKQIEGRDNRKILEEVGREIAGRPLTLSVTIGGAAAQQPRPEKQERAEAKPRVEDHPAVRAIVDKFHGEVVEVLKPKNQA